MKVSHAWLQTYFAKPIPAPDKLAELFTFHSFEVEGVEKIAGPDSILDLKILPDRAHYCLSHRGVAEEISVLTGMPVREKNTQNAAVSGSGTDIRSGMSSAMSSISVTILDTAFCRRFTGRLVENISAADSPAWLAGPLVAIGQRSIGPIVDITNFVMFDIGQPTHAFDADKIAGNIVIRAAADGETITLLDGKEYILTADDHVIADETGPLDIAGVKGGKRAEVTAATRRILITSANFNPSSVRRTSTRLNLRNEASKRFENEITPELAPEGLDMLSSLLSKVCPSARLGPVIDQYPLKAARTIIALDPAYITERIGVEVPQGKIRDILTCMGIVIEDKKGKTPDMMWTLIIPFHRLDLIIPEDIVEEVGRIYGYEHVAGRLPPPANIPAGAKKVMDVETDQQSQAFYRMEKIKNILADCGFSEVYLYTLVPKGDIRVAYPLASDKAALRTTLAAGLGASLEANARNADLLGLDAVKIFEVGKVFAKNPAGDAQGSGYVESRILAIAATQVKKVKGIDGKSLITAALDKIRAVTGIDLPVKSLLSSGPHAVCEIELDRLQIPPRTSETAAVSDAALSLSSSAMRYRPFSLYPFIVRDIAVFVPEGIAATEVWDEAAKGISDGEAAVLLVRHSLFDTFAKDGKISYAFRLIFQAMDRTLTDAEANAVMEKVYAHMSGRGWQVR